MKPKRYLLHISDLVIILAISIIVLVVAKFRSIVQLVTGGDVNSSQLLFSEVSSKISATIGKIDEIAFTASAATFLLWGVIGIICYLLTSLISQAVHNVSEEIDIENHYAHPRDYSPQRQHATLFMFTILNFVTLILFVGWFVLLIKFFLPLSFTNVDLAFFYYDSITSSSVAIVESILSMMIILSTLLILYRAYRGIYHMILERHRPTFTPRSKTN